jgi:hypothetical protein
LRAGRGDRSWSERALGVCARVGEGRCGVRDMCKPIAIWAIVGIVGDDADRLAWFRW